MIFDLNEGYSVNNDITGFDMESIVAEEYTLDDPVMLSMEIQLQAESNWVKLQEAVGRMELHAVQEEGTTAIYEANLSAAKDRIKGYFDKAKAWVKKWAGYIKGFFIKCFKMIESLVASDAKFVNDNRKIIEGLGSEAASFKFSGFKYTTDTAISIADKISPYTKAVLNRNGIEVNDNGTMINHSSSATQSAMSELAELKKEQLDKLRGSALGEKDLSPSDFKSECFKKFRNGETSKTTITVSGAYGSLGGLVDTIANTKKAKNDANKSYTAAKNSINKAIKELNAWEKDVLKGDKNDARDNTMKAISVATDILKGALTIENSAHGEQIKAIKANNRQARSVAAHLIGKFAKVKTTKGLGIKESYDFDDDTVFYEGVGATTDSLSFLDMEL